MSFGHCSCPDCGTTLRIRDRTFVGRTVPCPECRASLVIELDRDETLTARKPPRDKAAKSATATARTPAAVKAGPPVPTWADGLRRVIGSPLALAWALALAVTALVVVAMLRPAVRFRSPGSPVPPQAAADKPVTPEHAPPELDASPHPSPKLPSPNDPPAAPMVDATTPANVSEPLPTNPPPAQQPGAEPAVKPFVADAVKPPLPSPPVPSPVPKIDFDIALKQRLLSFDQSKPASRRDLIELLEEMLGAPIRYDAAELGEKNLDKLVMFKTENTTLGGVLKSILDPAGWEFVTEETRLRIRPKTTAASTP